jgi:hypothetical protein
MAKGRSKGNRETKKPKADKAPKGDAVASRPQPFGSMRPPKDSPKGNAQ